MADRDELLDAADRAIRRLGHDASMAGIASEAGITKPVLYRHFGDRDGLLAALATRHTERLLPELRAALVIDGDVAARLRATVDAYLGLIEADPEIYLFLSSGSGVSPASPVATFTARFTAELADGLRVVPGLAATDPRADLWAHALVAMVRAVGDAWLAGGEPRDRRAVADLVAELVSGGLTAWSVAG